MAEQIGRRLGDRDQQVVGLAEMEPVPRLESRACRRDPGNPAHFPDAERLVELSIDEVVEVRGREGREGTGEGGP